MSRIDKLRARQSLSTPPPVPETTQKPAKPPKAANAKLSGKKGTVTFSCGHEGQLGLCGPCKQAQNQHKSAKRKARKAEKKAAGGATKERLPNGSIFTAMYDAEKQQWSGNLIINGRTFEATAGGIKKLCFVLDDLYRAALQPAQG